MRNPTTSKRRTAAMLAAAAIGATTALLSPTAASADHEDAPTTRELLEACDEITDVCEFHPEGPPTTHTEGAELVIDDARNCSTTDQTVGRVWSHSKGGKNSLGYEVSAEYGFSKVFSVAVKQNYNHEWRWDTTYGGRDETVIAPGRVGQLWYTAEMATVKGRYEMHFPDRFHGHYIWYVPFEATQNVSGNGGAEEGGSSSALMWTDRELTEEERAQYC